MEKKTPNSIDVAVGMKIRQRRMLMGLSQERLGESLGITFQQVQKYEKGTNRVSASKLQAVADTLKVPVSYFFEEVGGQKHEIVPGEVLNRNQIEVVKVMADMPPQAQAGVLAAARAIAGALSNSDFKIAAE